MDLCLEALLLGRAGGVVWWERPAWGGVGHACIQILASPEDCCLGFGCSWALGAWDPHHSGPLICQFFLLCTWTAGTNTACPQWQLLSGESSLAKAWPADRHSLEAGMTARHRREPNLATPPLHCMPLDFVVGGMPALFLGLRGTPSPQGEITQAGWREGS